MPGPRPENHCYTWNRDFLDVRVRGGPRRMVTLRHAPDMGQPLRVLPERLWRVFGADPELRLTGAEGQPRPAELEQQAAALQLDNMLLIQGWGAERWKSFRRSF